MKLINIAAKGEQKSMHYIIAQLHANLPAYLEAKGFAAAQLEALHCDEKTKDRVYWYCTAETTHWFEGAAARLDKNPRVGLLNGVLERLSARLDLDLPMRIYNNEKELKIQEARLQWLHARDAAEAALQAYKTEKGDYYKQRLAVPQND